MILCVIELPCHLQKEEEFSKHINWLHSSKVMTDALQHPKEFSDIVEFLPKPMEPFSRPIHGQLVRQPKLILKLRKRKSSKYLDNESIISAQYIGVTEHVIRFCDLADFQFFPRLSPDTRECLENIKNQQFHRVMKQSLSVGRQGQDPNVNASRIAPPPIFSHISIPYDYRFEMYSALNLKGESEKGKNGEPLEGSLSTNNPVPNFPSVNKRSRRSAAFYKSIEDNFSVPLISPEEERILLSFPKHLVEQLKAHFADRPIWSFVALYNQFMEKEDRKIIRKILPNLAYYFSNGPWRHCWIRQDYDPRVDPKARFYQILELRSFFNRDVRMAKLYAEENWGKKAEGKDKAGKELDPTALSISRSHILDENIDPLTISHLFQLCDVRDEIIQRLVANQGPLNYAAVAGPALSKGTHEGNRNEDFGSSHEESNFLEEEGRTRIGNRDGKTRAQFLFSPTTGWLSPSCKSSIIHRIKDRWKEALNTIRQQRQAMSFSSADRTVIASQGSGPTTQTLSFSFLKRRPADKKRPDPSISARSSQPKKQQSSYLDSNFDLEEAIQDDVEPQEDYYQDSRLDFDLSLLDHRHSSFDHPEKFSGLLSLTSRHLEQEVSDDDDVYRLIQDDYDDEDEDL